ncbi:MAG: hypothetical protein PHI28_12980, partial [Mangrovibacterium sp.]|nr:hypothetical protein [Mangrovibacterium sp.]
MKRTILFVISIISLMAVAAELPDGNLQAAGKTVTNKGASQPAQAASLQTGKLTCEYLENPLGIDMARPRFSWTLVSDGRNQKQLAYELIVSDNREDIERLNGNVWKTGKMTTSRSLHLVYDGLPLKSFHRYYWRVKVYDQNDLPSSW